MPKDLLMTAEWAGAYVLPEFEAGRLNVEITVCGPPDYIGSVKATGTFLKVTATNERERDMDLQASLTPLRQVPDADGKHTHGELHCVFDRGSYCSLDPLRFYLCL